MTDLYTDEVWQPIPTAPEYEASSYGYIRKRENGRILSDFDNSNGVPSVWVIRRGKRSNVAVHLLVAEAFHGMPPDENEYKYRVENISGEAWDVRPENLKWVRQRANATLTVSDVRQIKHMLREGYRQCDIANEMGTSQQIVYQIKAGKTWKDVS